MLFSWSREELMERFRKQADGPPSAISEADYHGGDEDEAQIMTFSELTQLIGDHCRSFLHLTGCDQDVDLAVWATELLEYFNGPAPEIAILSQGNDKTSLFRVTIDPEMPVDAEPTEISALPVKTWLYRVLENDEDGDPIDFGIVRASDKDDAVNFVTERLREIGFSGRWPLRLYPLAEVDCGVPETAGDFIDLEVDVPEEA